MIFINNSNCKTDIAFPLYFINLPWVCGKKLCYSVFLFTEQFFKILWKHLLDHTHITDTKVKVQKFKFVICRNHVKITVKTQSSKTPSIFVTPYFQSKWNYHSKTTIVSYICFVNITIKISLAEMKWEFKIKIN